MIFLSWYFMIFLCVPQMITIAIPTARLTILDRLVFFFLVHSRPQRPRSFWSAPRITTSGQVQHRKSAIHGLPITLRTLRVKSDKFDWFWCQSIVFTKPFKTGMSLDLASLVTNCRLVSRAHASLVHAYGDTAAKWLRMLQVACVISAREGMGIIETNCVKTAAI